MKRYFYCVVLCLSYFGCNERKSPSIKFEEEEKIFIIEKGESFATDFKFINNGNDTLLIKSATGNCGCTSIDYPKEGVPPLMGGTVHVVFDSNLIDDTAVTKAILLEANTNPILTLLSLKGKINYRAANSTE